MKYFNEAKIDKQLRNSKLSHQIFVPNKLNCIDVQMHSICFRISANCSSLTDLHSKTGRDGKKGKTQERMERGSRKRSSSAGSEKMERVGGR